MFWMKIIYVKFKKSLDIILYLCYIIIRTKRINDTGGQIMKRYAKESYWIAKEERAEYEAEQERKEREYEMTQEDIDDIKYREARENGELDYIFG